MAMDVTLDMLGRQQIAGIPTAISELFKNAHDAYAERVEVDYYRRDELFVLRDDGLGMGRDEFVDRWLTIATETSFERKRAEARLPKPAKRSRPVPWRDRGCPQAWNRDGTRTSQEGRKGIRSSVPWLLGRRRQQPRT